MKSLLSARREGGRSVEQAIRKSSFQGNCQTLAWRRFGEAADSALPVIIVNVNSPTQPQRAPSSIPVHIALPLLVLHLSSPISIDPQTRNVNSSHFPSTLQLPWHSQRSAALSPHRSVSYGRQWRRRRKYDTRPRLGRFHSLHPSSLRMNCRKH